MPPKNQASEQPSNTSSEIVPSEPTAPQESETLDEFCTRLSQTDKRVEMIGAFHAQERQAGRTKDVASAFTARYQSFCNQPV